MAKMWTRVKYQYGRYLRLSRLTAIFIVIGLVYLLYRSLLTGPISGLQRSRNQNIIQNNPSNNELDAHLRNIYDARPQSCLRKKYSTSPKPSVSVIFTFHNHEFYNLKLTLESFLKHTPNTAYSEVIVLDDGTDVPEITKEVSQFLGGRQFGRLRTLRSETRDGEAASRFKASKTSTGSILVFANSHVIFNEGWLEPLVEYVMYNSKSIATPHADNYLHGYKFFPLSSKLINVFSLTLATLHLESPEEIAEDGTLMTPVMRGDVFAVIREYYESIGEHDEIFKHGGGHDVELSLRTWLCGGEIKIIMCSRIAIHDALNPNEVTEPQNIRRLTELWLDSYKPIIYKQRSDISRNMEPYEANKFKARKVRLERTFRCKTIDWYLSNVALDMIIPTDNFEHFGKFRSDSGYCMKHSNSEIKMVQCQPMFYQPDMLFELNADGLLMNALKCLSVKDKEQVILVSCQNPTLNEKWSLNIERKLLRNKAHSELCLEHTPHSPSPLRMSQCSDTKRHQSWSVLKY